MSIEAMKLALFALDIVKIHYTQNRHINEAMTALEEALADPMREVQRLGQEIEQEPPKYSFKAHWERDGRIGVVGAVVRPDGGVHLLQDFIDPPQPEQEQVMMEIFWGGEEAGVKLTQGFIDSHKVLQLDVLIDAKAEIERIYEELLGAKE